MKRSSSFTRILFTRILFTRILFTLALAGSCGLATAQLTNNGATIVIEQGATLVVEGAIDNTIDWPVQRPYGSALDDAQVSSTGGERVRVGIVIPPMAMTCVPGPTGPTYHSGAATPGAEPIEAYVKIVHRGQAEFIPVDLLLEVRNNEPPVGDRQVIETEILSMSLTGRRGNHPNITQLSCVAKPGGTGRTLLRAAGPGEFYVDSFFDVFFDISVTGAAGTPFEGLAIDAEFPMRLRQVLDVFDGVPFGAIGAADVFDDGVCLTVDKLGSSGLDGVRFGSKKGYDAYMSSYSVRLRPPSGVAGLLGEGQSMAMYPHPPPPEPEFPDLPDLPARSIVCTNTAGVVSVACSSNAVRASEWIVEVWEDGELRGVAIAPDESTCWSVAAAAFRPVGVGVSGATRRRGRAMSTSVVLENPTPVSIRGAAEPVVGNCIVVSPRDPQLLLGGIDRLDILSNCDQLCVESVEVSEAGVEFRGLDNAVISGSDGRVKVSNLGSSGCDGVSISSAGGDGVDNDCDGICLPFSTKLEPLDVEGSGGSFFISSLDAAGGNVASAEYRGGGGSGGRIFVNYNTASSVCRVSVLNGGVPVGEFDVPITANTETEVCTVGGAPRLTGCGKLRLGWPWELSCLVEEFDRPVPITPVGSTPMIGDEIRLLAPGATAAEVESIRSIQLRCSGLPELVLCGTTTGPFLPSPVLPPSPATDWEFPGVGLALAQESNGYYTWDPATGTAVCVNKTVRDWQLTGQSGNERTYSAIMDLHLEGVGGLVYSKDFELPGTFTVELGSNPFAGQDVQHYGVQLLDYSFELPQGSDPDIRTLRVRAGSDHGFPSPGDVITRKIPECELEIQAILDILADFQLEGSQGGPLAGGGPLHVAAHEVAHVVQQRGGVAGGVAFRPLGGAEASVADDVLTISNIGSSGQDGVSVDLPSADAVTLRCEPVQLMPGGSLSFTMRGSAAGQPQGAGLGGVLVQRAGDPEPFVFFDITCDVAALSPDATIMELYNDGELVATLPGSTTRALPIGGQPLPGIKCCGGYSEVSGAPAGYSIQFDSDAVFRPAGADVLADEVRCRFVGIDFAAISSADIKIDDIDGEMSITEIGVGAYGREIVMGGPSRATDHNSSRSNKTSSIAFDPDPDGDGDTGTSGFAELRAPRSVFLPGQRQLWPLSCLLDPASPVFEEVGGSMKLEAFGTINATTNASYGVLEACFDGEKFVLKGDFTSRGNSQIRAAVVRQLDKSSTMLQEEVVSSGGDYAEVRPFRGGGAFPLCRVSAVPELYEPPFNEVECSYSLSFDEMVEVTLPGRSPVIGNRIDIQLVAPTHVSEDIGSLRISGHGIKPLVLEGLGTGPFYGQGLSNATVGSAQIEEQAPGDRGVLVVSNIGSSGEDGVRVDLGVGEGLWQTVEPLGLSLAGASLGLSVVEPCLGTPEDCEELAKVRIAGGPGDNPIFQQSSHTGSNPLFTVVGTSGGNLGGSVVISSDGSLQRVGTVAAEGGGRGHVVGYGLLPSTVIEGVGRVPACIAIDYDRPMVFSPADGGAAFVFRRLRLAASGDDGQPLVEAARQMEVRLARVPRVEVTNTELFHLNKRPHESLGVAELVPIDGVLQVGNLGSSGLDGVRRRASKLHDKMTQLMMAITAPPGGGGQVVLTATPSGLVGGLPDQDFGSSVITLGDPTVPVQIGAGFAGLGAPGVGVLVCDGEDNDCDGWVDGDGGGVAEVVSIGGLPLAVVGYGYLPEQPLPGGLTRPAGLFWQFENPVEVRRPGAEPGTGLTGDRVLLVPDGGAPVQTELVQLDLQTSGLPQLNLLNGSPPDSFFDIWLELNFTPAQIALLDAAGYNIDFDGDGYGEGQEFIIGLNPWVADGTSHRPDLSTVPIDGPAGPQRHIRISYEVDPSKQGVRNAVECSTDLKTWVEGPELFRLISIDSVGGGNRRYTWERTEPISGLRAEKYRHRGHVTVLK